MKAAVLTITAALSLLAGSAWAGPADALLRIADRQGVDAAITAAQTARMSARDRDRLLGHLYLRRRDFEQAKLHLERAVRAAPGLEAAWLELAVVEHELGHPKASLRALERGRGLGQARPSFFALAAENLRLEGAASGADEMLRAGLARFEGDVALLRAQVGLLLDLGAPGAALERAGPLFASSPDPDRERRHLARRLVARGAPGLAAEVLEPVIAAHPNDLTRAAELAWAYAEAGHALAAARLIDPRRGLGARLAYEAAEQYRAAGALQDALRVNGFVTPPARARGQRLVILVESGQLERAAASAADVDVETLGDNPRFALAFALAYTGRPARALGLLEGLEAPERFEALEGLRAAIEGARR